MHLSKSKLGSGTFIAANDIISAPKKYSVVTAVFALLIMLVMVPADNDMPASIYQEKIYGIGAKIGDKVTTLSFQHNPGTDTKDYVYGEGVAPENINEISISYTVAKEYDIEVGDEITLYVEGEEIECIVTSLHQSMVRMGKANRLHQDFNVSSFSSVAMLDYQINFDDELTEDELNKRIKKLRNIFDTDKIVNTKDFAIHATGAYETIALVKNMVLIIVLAIVILIAVLMERSFISAEKAEIALMKAIGFSNKSIIWHHTLRFAMVAMAASLIAAVLCLPATNLAIDPIFVIMGAIKGVNYEIKFAEIFLCYPAILVAVAIIAAFFTAIYTNTIKSSDASNIE